MKKSKITRVTEPTLERLYEIKAELNKSKNKNKLGKLQAINSQIKRYKQIEKDNQ